MRTVRVIVVLLTVGEETCDGDPVAAIEGLKASGVDVRVNIVGFAIDEEALAKQFDSWASLGGGRYFDADNETASRLAMQQALQPKYQVLDQNSNVVAEGTAGGEPVPLDAGTYTVRVLGLTHADGQGCAGGAWVRRESSRWE